jgi:hypothetical protein
LATRFYDTRLALRRWKIFFRLFFNFFYTNPELAEFVYNQTFLGAKLDQTLAISNAKSIRKNTLTNVICEAAGIQI